MPIDGEVGLGPDDTVITAVRLRTSPTIRFNDDDSPAALDIGAYFAAGGAGNDLTLTVRTAAGAVSVAVADAVGAGRAARVDFDITAAGWTLLDDLAVGDLFILAVARPAPVELTVTGEAGSGQAGVGHADGGGGGRDRRTHGERRCRNRPVRCPPRSRLPRRPVTSIVATGTAGAGSSRVGHRHRPRACRRHEHRRRGGRRYRGRRATVTITVRDPPTGDEPPLHVRVEGVYEISSNVFVKDGGAWAEAAAVHRKSAGSWEEVWRR